MPDPSTNRRQMERLEARLAKRDQEIEFHKAILAIAETMPEGSTVGDALGSPAGIKARRKWELRYGRPSPISGQ